MTTKKPSAFSEILSEIQAEEANALRAETKVVLVNILKESERRAGYIKERKAQLAALDTAQASLMKAFEANNIEAVREVAANVNTFRTDAKKHSSLDF